MTAQVIMKCKKIGSFKSLFLICNGDAEKKKEENYEFFTADLATS